MKRLALLLVLALSFPLTARADDASRHAKAREMVALLHLDRLMDQMMDGVKQEVTVMTRQMAGNSITPEDQVKLDAFQAKVFVLVEAEISWKEMEPIFVDLYARTFTDEQLNGIVAFYKSPAGAAMIEKLPGLTSEAQEISQKRMVSIQPQLKQLMEDFAKEMALQQ